MASAGKRLSPVGSETCSENYESDEEKAAQFFLEAFLGVFVNSIKWNELIFYDHFDMCDIDKYRRIAKLDEKNAVLQMLEAILKNTSWPHRFGTLIKLLEHEGHEKAVMILQRKCIPADKSIYQELIKKNLVYICDNLEVKEILPHLIGHKVIIEKDRETICKASCSRRDEALALMLDLPNRSRSWYQGFIKSLVESKQDHIAMKIDEGLTKKYMEKLEAGESLGEIDRNLTSMISFIPAQRKIPGKERDQTDVKQPFSLSETEPKQLLSAELGTLEAEKLSYTSNMEISVDNLSPNSLMSDAPPLLLDSGKFSNQPSLPDSGKCSGPPLEPVSGKCHNDSENTSVNDLSVNKLSPFKTDENRSVPTQMNSVKRSLEEGMDMSLSFSSLLVDQDNTGVKFQRTQAGAEKFNDDSSSGRYEPPFSSGERSSDDSYNSFTSDLLQDVRSTSLSAEENRNNSLSCKPKMKSDFLDIQKLTIAKSTGCQTTKDSDNNVDMEVKGFRDKNVSLEEQTLNIKESLGADHEREEVEDKDISLRKYQEELAASALEGKNVIIVAPTGSGKTRVAMRIIQEHIRRQQGHGIAKVIFLVNQVALANQQADACRELLKKYSSKVITGESQRKSECLKDFIYQRDILIVTAQVLLDALVRKDVSSINCFSLIVFDECHHTHANHTFNQIMGRYMDLKFSKAGSDVALPQIVGLTASVGVGKAKNVEKAVDHIKHLMANLDAQVISTVQNNMGELREHVSLPEEETWKVPKREGDKFGESVVLLMNTIEKRISQSSLVKEIPEAPLLEKALKAPAQKGSAQYTQWVSKLWRETAKVKSSESRRFLNSNRANLEHYNNALIIYNDARMEDALTYLDTEMSKWKENAIMDDNEKILYGAFQKLRKYPFPRCTNPKLDKLCEIIKNAYARDPENSRGIVFVKTRDLASAIVRWMRDTPGLRELRPIIFTGSSSSADKGGMTKVEQDDALEYFRDGKHKLIVATSVAEEGLDISKCNLVIRYDHVTNEIAMVQSRGRGRASDSKYYVIAEERTGMAEKEELNMIREVMMRKAIIQLQEYIVTSPEKFRQEIHKFQDEANLDRELKSLGKGRKLIRMVGQFELRCVKCDQFVCWSDSIKKIEESHHVVIDDHLSDRVTFARSGSARYQDETIQFVGKLICKTCGGNLGVICIHRTVEFPVLKIENFLVVDTNGRQSTCKRWKSVPFQVQALSNEDWREIIKARKEHRDETE